MKCLFGAATAHIFHVFMINYLLYRHSLEPLGPKRRNITKSKYSHSGDKISQLNKLLKSGE